jgi:hypothetical protein
MWTRLSQFPLTTPCLIIASQTSSNPYRKGHQVASGVICEQLQEVFGTLFITLSTNLGKYSLLLLLLAIKTHYSPGTGPEPQHLNSRSTSSVPRLYLRLHG